MKFIRESDMSKVDEDKLRGILEGLSFTLNSGQIKFIRSYIEGNGHHVLTSPAGAGKGVMISILKEYYGDEMALGASTGVANQNLMDGRGGEGSTHRIFSIPIHLGDEAGMKKVNQPCSKLFSGSDLIRHVCLDEFFMHNPEHLHVILKRIERFNKKTSKRNSRKIRLLGVGDPLQVGSVLIGNDKPYLQKTYGSHLMFRSSVWKVFNPTVTVLQETERQKDKVFKASLDVLRYGQEERYDGALKWLNKRVNYNYKKDAFTISTYVKTAEQVNQRVLHNNINPKMEFRAIVSGKFNMKDHAVEENITLCEGLECITTVNSQEGEYSNGSSCTILSMTVEGCWCYFPHSGKEIFVGLHDYEQTESYIEGVVVGTEGEKKDVLKRRVVGSASQIPLLQNSAYSVHRAQGKTFTKEGVLDIGYGFKEGNDFGQNILYVGLSRWTSVDLITLPRPLERKHISVCRDSIDFWHECVAAQQNT
jgi:ATP-dependent DNA helicase PIF1